MELKKGDYYKRRDGECMSESNLHKSNRVREIMDNGDNYLINGKYTIAKDNVVIIDQKEFLSLQNKEFITVQKSEKQKVINETAERAKKRLQPIADEWKGQMVRKKGWAFFDDVPVLRVNSAKVVTSQKTGKGRILVNKKSSYLPEDLIILNKQDGLDILQEFEELKISKCLKGDINTSHFKGGDPTVLKKKFMTPEQALKVLFQMKKRDKNSKLQAYKCEFCPAYHIGNLPDTVKEPNPRAWYNRLFGFIGRLFIYQR